MEPQTQGQGNMNMGGDMNQGAPMGAPTPAPMMNQGGNDATENKGIAVAVRIPILFWIPFASGNKSPFVMFHANQGLLHLIAVVGLSFILGFLPFLNLLLIPILYIGSFIFMIMGMIQASKGEMKPLPIIGEYKLLN